MSESEEEKIEVPEYTVRHNELSEDLLEEIVIVAANAIKQCAFDKDAAVVVADYLRRTEKYEDLGQGEWQCVIGKKFTASLTYDTGVLFFFDLKKLWKSVLVFKSG